MGWTSSAREACTNHPNWVGSTPCLRVLLALHCRESSQVLSQKDPRQAEKSMFIASYRNTESVRAKPLQIRSVQHILHKNP